MPSMNDLSYVLQRVESRFFDMKAFPYPLLAAALAALTFFVANGQTPTPQVTPPAAVAPAPAAETPAIAPTPGGTSVAGTVGLTIYNNAIYLVRDTGVTLLDASTIPAGHMMTLDGRVVPLPAGTKFPQAVAPKLGSASRGN
jgi:hypothetical protein